MGGYHVTGRQSSGGNKYIALESYLRVPNNVVSDSRTTTYTEFIYSLWRGSYGLDVGIGYGFPGSEGKWKLFAWGKTAVVGQWQEAPTSVYLNEGETVSISVAINKLARGYVKAEVRRGAQVIHSYDFHITNEAYDQMIQGCTFTRECLLASNGVASQYVNCGANLGLLNGIGELSMIELEVPIPLLAKFYQQRMMAACSIGRKYVRIVLMKNMVAKIMDVNVGQLPSHHLFRV